MRYDDGDVEDHVDESLIEPMAEGGEEGEEEEEEEEEEGDEGE